MLQTKISVLPYQKFQEHPLVFRDDYSSCGQLGLTNVLSIQHWRRLRMTIASQDLVSRASVVPPTREQMENESSEPSLNVADAQRQLQLGLTCTIAPDLPTLFQMKSPHLSHVCCLDKGYLFLHENSDLLLSPSDLCFSSIQPRLSFSSFVSSRRQWRGEIQVRRVIVQSPQNQGLPQKTIPFYGMKRDRSIDP